MSVPFFDLKRQYESIKDEVEPRVLDVMRSTAYVEGPAVKELESQLADYLGVKHVVSCGNGTDSLKIALKAAGVKPGDEVITTPFTFFATAEAIANAGAIPVFVDIEEETLNIDPDRIEEAITDKTSAILPVHIFGVPADMDRINEIARRYDLKVIEDACQAIGSEYCDRKAGNLGDLGCFSFYPTKNLGAFGDGGMVVTNDDDAADACRTLKAHAAGKLGFAAARKLGHDVEEPAVSQSADGLYDPYKYFNYLIADNSRLDSMQAAVLSVKLERLDGYNEARRAIAKRYDEALDGLPIRLPSRSDSETRKSCWHQYVILCEEKDELIKYLGDKGIGAGSFYPVPLHLQKAFDDLGYGQGSLPVAESACKRSVCLPIFPELTLEEQDEVVGAIRSFFDEKLA